MAPQATERILVCLRYGIGDVVMETPALRALRAERPSARLTALGAWPVLELFAGDPVFDRLQGIQEFGFRHWGDRGSAGARDRMAVWLDANDFTEILDASHTAIGIREVIEARPVPSRNTEGRLEVDSGPANGRGARSIRHSATRAWGLSRASGAIAPRLHLPESARQVAARFFRRHGLEGRQVIGIAPVASSRLKRWPLDRVFALLRRLAGERDCHVLVFGLGAHDKRTVARLGRAIGEQRLVRVEPAHLQRTAALIGQCDALVSNDTGLMHMGGAMGTPTIGIFGPTSPQVLLPLEARAAGPPHPCGYRPTDRFGPPRCVLDDRCLVGPRSCINLVSVDEVARLLNAALATEPDALVDQGSLS